MADVRIRNLPDDIKMMLKDEAARRGQNLEAYLREVLSEQALSKRRAWADQLRVMRQELFEKYGLFSDSAAIIREERDARG
jgi:plasmid stability protein